MSGIARYEEDHVYTHPLAEMERRADGEWVRYTDHAATVAAMQARIDELMLEYCPHEMTQEQFDEWARHQAPVDEGAAYAITEAGRKALEERK